MIICKVSDTENQRTIEATFNGVEPFVVITVINKMDGTEIYLALSKEDAIYFSKELKKVADKI